MKSWFGYSCLAFACLLVLSPRGLAADCVHPTCLRCAQKACNLTVSKKTVETECFDVECKDICIPPVTFPWQCSPKHCGRVRTVNVLTADKEERQVCEYKWDVRTICPGCREALQATGSDQVVSERVVCDAAPELSPAPAPQTATGPGALRFRFPLLRR